MPRAPRFADLYRGVFGVLLVMGAALLFLSSNDVLSGVRDAALTTVVVVVAIGLILAPFLWRLGRASPPSAPSGSAPRSAPSSPPTSTTRCSRR